MDFTTVTAFGDVGAERLIAPPAAVTTRAVARSADRIIVVEAMAAGARALITDFDGNSTQFVSLSSHSTDVAAAASEGHDFFLT